MKTNKIVITLLVLVVLAVGAYAWNSMKAPVPGFTNYETQKVEQLANPEAAASEEAAAIEEVEVTIDSELDTLEAQTFN